MTPTTGPRYARCRGRSSRWRAWPCTARRTAWTRSSRVLLYTSRRPTTGAGCLTGKSVVYGAKPPFGRRLATMSGGGAARGGENGEVPHEFARSCVRGDVGGAGAGRGGRPGRFGGSGADRRLRLRGRRTPDARHRTLRGPG